MHPAVTWLVGYLDRLSEVLRLVPLNPKALADLPAMRAQAANSEMYSADERAALCAAIDRFEDALRAGGN